ncbi:MAG: hypothetical protein V1829_00110 [bacterium]
MISQKGAISILLSILLLSVLLTISLGVSFLLSQQMKMSGQTGQSVIAFYAADAGAEKCLYQTRCVLASSPTAECITATGGGLNEGCASVGGLIPYTYLSSVARYKAERSSANSIISIGEFGDTSRKVELTW